MTQILALFAGHGLKFAAVAGMLAMVGTWDWRRMKAAEIRGAESVRVETMKANDAVITASERVRKKVNSAKRRGAIDPNTMD